MSVIEAFHRRNIKAARKQSLKPTETDVPGPVDHARRNWLFQQATTSLRGFRRLGPLIGAPEFHSALERYANAHSTKVMAAAHAMTHRVGASVSPRRLQQLTDQIEFSTRPVPTHEVRIPKENGWRYAVHFNHADYARMLILGDVLAIIEERVCAAPNYQSFSLSGMGGNHQCIKQTVRLIESGHRIFAYGDVESAYPSVRPPMLTSVFAFENWVLRILFPGEDMEGSAGARTTSTESTMTHSTPPNALRGAPQGSPSSKSVLGLVFGSVVVRQAPTMRAINQIADEVLASALTRTEAEAFLDRVRLDLLTAYSGGLRLGRTQIVDLGAGEPLEFLGYHIQLTEEGSSLIVHPSEKACRKARGKCLEKMLEHFAERPKDSLYEFFDVAYDYLIDWGNSFSEWRATKQEKAQFAFEEAGLAMENFQRQHAIPNPPLVSRNRTPVQSVPRRTRAPVESERRPDSSPIQTPRQRVRAPVEP